MKKKAIIITAVAVTAIVFATVTAVVIRMSRDKKTQFEDLKGTVIGGLEILEADNMSGPFVENGGNDETDSVFTLKIRNNGSQTLQYAVLHLACGESEYTFSLSTVPPCETVLVQEKNCLSCAEHGEWTASAEYLIWFTQEPSMCQDLFSVSFSESTIFVQNKSYVSVGGPIHVYYKNWDGENLVGGITYRATIQNGLTAGSVYNCYAPHFVPENSRIMFIDYVS